MAKFVPLKINIATDANGRAVDYRKIVEEVIANHTADYDSGAMVVSHNAMLYSATNARAFILSAIIAKCHEKNNNDPLRKVEAIIDNIFANREEHITFKIVWALMKNLSDAGVIVNRNGMMTGLQSVGVPKKWATVLERNQNIRNNVDSTINLLTSVIDHSLVDVDIEDLMFSMRLVEQRTVMQDSLQRIAHELNNGAGLKEAIHELRVIMDDATKVAVPAKSKTGTQIREEYRAKLIENMESYGDEEKQTFFPLHLSRKIDRALGGGLFLGEMGIVYAPTGGGKSTMLVEIFRRIARNSRRSKIAIFTTEITSENVLNSIVANASGVPRSDIMQGKVSENSEDFAATADKLLENADYIFQDNVYFLTSPYAHIDDLVEEIIILASKGVRLFVIDHIHAIDASQTEIYKLISEISRKLWERAMNDEVAILVAAQEGAEGGSIYGGSLPMKLAQFGIKIENVKASEIDDIDIPEYHVLGDGRYLSKIILTKNRYSNEGSRSEMVEDLIIVDTRLMRLTPFGM